MAILQDQLSTYLGTGFEDWAGMEKRFQTERKRVAYNRKRMNHRVFDPLTLQVQADLDDLEAITNDSKRGLELIALGRRIDKQAASQMYKLNKLGLELVGIENDILDGLFAIATFAYFAYFPFPILEERAGRMRKEIVHWQHELRMAILENTKAATKLFAHVILAALELPVMELSLLGHLGVAVTEEISEIVFGAKEPSGAERTLTMGLPVVKALAASVEHLCEFDDILVERAKMTGHVATGVTFLVDVKEIAEDVERQRQIQETLKELRSAWKDLKEFLEQYGDQLKRFQMEFARVELELGKAESTATDTRDAMNACMRLLRYNPNTPMVWAVVP